MAVAFKELHINRIFALADSIPLIVPQYIVDYYDSGYVGSYNNPANVTGSGLRPIVKTEFGVYKLNRNPSSNYNYFEVVNTEQDFDFIFRVFLNENTTQSELIPGTANTFHNGILEQAGFGENNHISFQPLITVGIGRGDFYRNLVSPPPPGSITRANSRYNSFGFVYEGGDLQLHYIDHITNASGQTNEIFLYKSSSVTISGAVTIGFSRRNGFDYFFNIEGYSPEPFGMSTITSGAMDNDKFITSGGESLFGTLPFNVYELRYLYSDVCDIMHTIDGVIQFRYTFGDNEIITDFGTRIDVENYIYPIDSTLELYNFALTDIVECNTCCIIADTPLVTSSNSELGCCFTPTVEDNIRYKINNWYLNSLGFSSIEYAEMMLKIGKSNEANAKLEKINSVHQFVFYIMSIRNRMVCEDKPYTDFVSDETLNKFVEYFNCRGINIKCPLQIAMIGNFTNCCDQIEASVDCECTDEIPSAIISAPIYQYDLNTEGDQTITYTEEDEYTTIVPFSCCSGNQSMVVSSTLINPHNLPISITPGPLTTDGTFSYDITYEYLDSVVTDVKEFYVQFTICGQTILRKHLYSAIDTCVTIPSTVVVENNLASVILDINDNFAFNVETVGLTINLGDFTCCHAGQVSKILSIDTTRITPESGLTILSPVVGQEGQGSILLSYYFNGEQALVGTIQRVYLSYSICDEIVYYGFIEFEVVNNCTPDIIPTLSPTTLDFDFNGLGSNTTSFQIGITDYQCCQGSNTITYWFPDNGAQAFTVMDSFGLKFNLPINTQQASNNIILTYSFDRAKYLQFITNGGTLPDTSINPWQIEMKYTVCDDATIYSYYIELTFDDTCAAIPGVQSTTSVVLDLYQSLGGSMLVNTEITYICAACDSTSNQFTYLGIDSGNNSARLTDTIASIPTSNLATGYNLTLRSRPHLIDIGDYNNPNYPVNQNSDLLTDSNCGANSLTINTFLVDNYFRSEGNTNVLQIKSNVFGYNPGDNNNLMFIVHLDNTKLELTTFNYTNLVVGTDPGDTPLLKVTLYSLYNTICTSYGSLTQNVNETSIILDAIMSGPVVQQINQDISLLSGNGSTPYTLDLPSVVPIDTTFYFVVVELIDATADYISVRFDITI